VRVRFCLRIASPVAIVVVALVRQAGGGRSDGAEGTIGGPPSARTSQATGARPAGDGRRGAGAAAARGARHPPYNEVAGRPAEAAAARPGTPLAPPPTPRPPHP